MATYFGAIADRTDGKNYRGMLLANQLTWGLTSFVGLYALFGGDAQLYLFWKAAEAGIFGAIALNWLGLSYAQYERAVEDTT